MTGDGDKDASTESFKREVIDALIRITRGDFAVRVQRNYRRDNDDILARLLNILAEELGRSITAREREHAALTRGVEELSEAFITFAAGDYAVRAPRTESGDAFDVLAFLFNNTVAEVGDAVAEVKRQREVVEAVLEAMLDGVIVIDARGLISLCNPAMAALLGRPVSDIVGSPLSAYLAPNELDSVVRADGAAARRSFRGRRTRFVDGAGRLIELEVNGSPLCDPGGEVTGSVLVARDDRELRAIEAQLLMSDRLATVGTVAAGVAHEINNPLAFIIANLEFLGEELDILAAAPGRELESDAIAEMKKAVGATLGGAHRVKDIVADLRAFARVESDATGVVDLAPVADTSIAMVRNELRHHARVVKDYGPTPAVVANEGRLVQVLVNLLQNAAHAIPAGDAERNELRISLSTLPTGEASIAVRDSGLGMTDAVAARIFEAFYTTKPIGVGTGLGLAICQKIITGIGGRIDVTTAPGAGSTFTVILPAATEQARSASSSIAAGIPDRRLRILAIDDEVEIGAALARTLGKAHELTFVSRAAAALAIIPRAQFDVVLCDVMMPDMTGVQFLAHLAADHPELTDRFVFMTGGAFSPGARELLENSSTPCLEKPFDGETLRAMLARVTTQR